MYIQFTAAPKSEAFASDSVMTLGCYSRRLRFLPSSCLLFPPLSSSVALTGLPRALSCALVSESRGTDKRGDPELKGSLLGRADTKVLYYLVLNIYFTGVATRRAYCDRLNLGLVSRRGSISPLPCFAGHHRPDRPPRSCLTRYLPSLAPLSSRGDYMCSLGVSRRPWYQIVAYHGDLFGVLEFGMSSVFAGLVE